MSEPDLDAVSESEVHTVLQCDPSQMAAVIKAQRAECLVVRGPPGTGKSQVIVNLVSDALARDKRVLVVCQKRAALDVVHDRLAEVGLGDAAFVVHDAVKDRSSLYKKLAARLTDRTSPTAPTLSDALQAHNRKIDGATAAIRKIVEPLNQRFHGKRLYELYGAARHGFRPAVEPPPEVLALDYEAVDRMARRLDEAKAGRLRFDAQRHPLALRKSWAALGHVGRSRLEEALAALASPPPSSSGSALIVDRHVSKALQRDLHTLRSLGGKWWRLLHPRWWMACVRVCTHQRLFGSTPREQWLPRLERGDTLADRIAALEPYMSDAWRDRMLALAEDGPRLQEAAEATLHAFREEFPAIQAHDLVMEELSPTERGYLDALGARLETTVDWGEHARQEVILRWIDEAEGKHPALRGRPFREYAALKRQLEQLLDEKQEMAADELAKVLRHRATTPSFPPGTEVHGNRKASTDWSRLEHELSKKRRVKPLRTLLREFDWPMRQLMPCWLASPEVVSEIFPLERGLFDVVIFDEASQLPVERALPVVYRGQQVVIAGDEQQMPPSRFFSAQLDELDDDDEDEVANEARLAESLLQQAKKIYGFDYLAWHYRSRYQELIDFSNHAFYDGKLHVAANVERRPAVPPIQWRSVDGLWENNTNAKEVRASVDHLHRHLEHSRGAFRSVGIITFNKKQRGAIQDEIERRRETDPNFAELMSLAENPPSGNRDDKPFVKNIEHVQGDERDHIIFSVGYAQDQDRRLHKRFGPLSVQGGENRLNVAITRARRRVTVLCSFEPNQLAVETSKNRGPVVFKRFLQYAKAVSESDHHGIQGAIRDVNPAVATTTGPRDLEFHSPFEEEVYDALRRHGYELETQWGVGGYRIDLVVVDPRDPSRFCLGIECDGATYHSGKSVRERDIARQRFLEGRDWTITRIWSRDWWVDP
ncbi:MAG: AAA domain-containing protein, partial [Myxococcota bacterium]